jgi:hypothetical protein
MIALLVDMLHLLLVFYPIIIFFIPINSKLMFQLIKYSILPVLLTPVHWPLFDNKCILSLVSQESGGLQNTETDSMFSEKYMMWLYGPILKLIGEKKDNNGLDKVIAIHWIFNFILIWIYIFYVLF